MADQKSEKKATEKKMPEKKASAKAAPAKKVDEAKGKKEKKKFQMPSAYVIVFLVLMLITALTYFIPVSMRDENTKQVIFNAMAAVDANGNATGQIIQNVGPQPYGIWDVLMAPVRGFADAADVGIAILMAGGFLSVMSLSGGLEAAIGKMLNKLKGAPLIIMMTLMTALMGTVFGFWEEILAFSLVVIPMFILAGYDVMLGMGVLFLGATVGNMAAVVNPFATGTAVAALNTDGLTMGSGIILRMVLFVVTFAICAFLLVRYGAMVKADPAKSILAGVKGVKASGDSKKNQALPEMTKKRAFSAGLFVLMIVVLIVGYIPWKDLGGQGLSDIVNAPILAIRKLGLVGEILGGKDITLFGDWGFHEFSVLFFGGAILLLFINKMNIDEWTDAFLAGAKDLLGVVFVLSMARGIALIMGSSMQGMSVTLVYWISSALAGVPTWTFAIFAVGAYLLIGLALQSTSGVAGISMPILGPVAAALFGATAIGAVGGQIVLISAFTIGLNFMCLLYPGAVNLGVCEMFGVPYGHYMKFMTKGVVPILIIATVILAVAPYLGLVS